MNTFDFIAENAGVGGGFIQRSGSGVNDCEVLLNTAHLQPSGKLSRFTDTWVIVGEGFVEMKQKFATNQPRYSDETAAQATARHIEMWDGRPRAFLFVEKKRLELSSIFLTYDLRAVRLCTPRGTITFDATREPGEGASRLEMAIWKARKALSVGAPAG